MMADHLSGHGRGGGLDHVLSGPPVGGQLDCARFLHVEHLTEHRAHQIVQPPEMAVEGGAADPGALGQGIDGDLTVLTGEVTGGGEDRRLGPRRAGIRGAAGGVGHLISLDEPAPGPPDYDDRTTYTLYWHEGALHVAE